jgi:protein CpxP
MKGQTMTSPEKPAADASPWRRLLFNRYTVAAFVAGAGLTAGVGALAAGAAMHQGMMMMDGTHSAAEVSAHVDHVLKHLYVEVEATDAQKAQIDPLVKQAVTDLVPMHSGLQTARSQAVQALTQTTVDRASLETARVTHLQFADQASKRITQLIADVGDVLTPTQRKLLTEHLEHLHGMSHP